MGLSPQVRGNRRPGPSPPRRGGSIPAGAGEPPESAGYGPRSKVYPRRCGGTRVAAEGVQDPPGLSPQVRGNQAGRLRPALRSGSIPAGAGEPPSGPGSSPRRRVYPRRCGGTLVIFSVLERAQGLSPQVRGNPYPSSPEGRRLGSIPAGAGEPPTVSLPPSHIAVYPRRCGGTEFPIDHRLPFPGLSPQVRGNRDGPAAHRGTGGSIPAGAGEPRSGGSGRSPRGVYPRRCGGTEGMGGVTLNPTGLSPQVRGNPPVRGRGVSIHGSIPAGAGEPITKDLYHPSWKVYPRRCGGTGGGASTATRSTGLSPQVRGNRIRAGPRARPLRSIPAGAGEPYWRHARRRADGVYPRRCGGTIVFSAGSSRPAGLSPQVRGNLLFVADHPDSRGSIPAGAGEPRSGRRSRHPDRVYPRRCGGTALDAGLATGEAGLSPQVRGNPHARPLAADVGGSIPAGAGEPPCEPDGPLGRGVYPRRCGGTSHTGGMTMMYQGLSPQVRGNRPRRGRTRRVVGSIPAGAGEPR